jgi:hypothetical protein
MDRAPEGSAGPAAGRRGDSGGADAGSASARAAAAVAAQQAICRILCDRPALLDAVRATAMDAGSAAHLTRLILAGCESALCDADTATVLVALRCFACETQTGAARVSAAGVLPHAVALMRSPRVPGTPPPWVAHAAVGLCWGAAGVDAAAKAALARDPSAVPALLAVLLGAPPPWDEADVAALSTAANLLGLLAIPSGRAVAVSADGSPVTAAVLAGGGVARIVAVLRAALGGGGQILDAQPAGLLLMALNAFNSTHPGAAAAARAAGALPLAARAVVAAQRTPGPFTKNVLNEALVSSGVLAAADDLPALAARPDLVGALAGAVALAADGAAEGWSALQAEQLGRCATGCAYQLLAGGQGSSDAAAEGFLAAGGAAHLVRRRARVSVSARRARSGQGAYNLLL